jgi:Ala-tRNA(Pro) deacylase
VTGNLMPASAADPDVYIRLLDSDELYFNAGRLDRSVALASQDYMRLARPRIARIIAA